MEREGRGLSRLKNDFLSILSPFFFTLQCGGGKKVHKEVCLEKCQVEIGWELGLNDKRLIAAIFVLVFSLDSGNYGFTWVIAV